MCAPCVPAKRVYKAMLRLQRCKLRKQLLDMHACRAMCCAGVHVLQV